MPRTLSWKPRSSTVSGTTSGAAAPSASAAHGEVGRWSSLHSDRTPSMTPERTAGAGSPITAM